MIPVSRGGWIACPVCRKNRRLLRITPVTRARNLPVFCRECKSEILLTVELRPER